MAQEDIEALQQYIIDLKNKFAVYIPVKGDKLDMKIAEFLNQYPDREKINRIKFSRESEGVYNFGTKKVNLSLHKETINAKKGGGY